MTRFEAWGDDLNFWLVPHQPLLERRSWVDTGYSNWHLNSEAKVGI